MLHFHLTISNKKEEKQCVLVSDSADELCMVLKVK